MAGAGSALAQAGFAVTRADSARTKAVFGLAQARFCGEFGRLTKSACAAFSPRSLSHSFLPPALLMPAHLTDNSRACHTLVIKL